MARILLNFFRASANSYGFSVTIGLLLSLLIGERWVLVAFYNTFAPPLWLPSLLLFPLALLTRSWLTAGLTLAPLLAFAFTYGARFLLATTTAPPANLSVLTYNLLANGRDPRESLEVIREANADIVSLQELSLTVSEAIERELSELYPHRALYPQARGTQGQGVLSKYPIREHSYWQYDDLPAYLGHQRAVINVAGAYLVVYNVHPSHPGMSGSFFDPSTRSADISRLLGSAAGERLPVLFMGDFNMPELSDDYKHITMDFGDSYGQVGRGLGWTFPYIGTMRWLPPFLRLDYVFFSSRFVPVSAQVWHSSGGSDHYPLWVSFAFK
jgi:endonuclease/exonuclease/phosphatase (EEP) superfamily protein YafD